MAIDTNGIDTARREFRINSASTSGLISVAGDTSRVVTINGADNTKLDVLGGTGQIITNTMGKSIDNIVAWDATTISGGVTDGVFIVAVDLTGTVIIFDNGGNSNFDPDQSNIMIHLGSYSMTSSVVSQAFTAYRPVNTSANSLFALFMAIAPFNFVGEQGYTISGLAANLQLGISAGSALAFGIAVIDDVATPDVLTRPERSPTPLVAPGDPVTGDFAFSATAEIDPTLVSKKGVITVFAVSGANTVVTSNGHGLDVGSIVTITETTNYNGSFNVLAITGNTFTIDTTFIADDATGNWTGLALAASNNFTAQRSYLFAQSGIVGVFYGLEQYATIADFDAAGGEFAEGFLEPAVVANAIKTDIIIVRQNIATFADVGLSQFRKPISRFK